MLRIMQSPYFIYPLATGPYQPARSQKVNTLKQVIQATLKDTEANIGNLINQDR